MAYTMSPMPAEGVEWGHACRRLSGDAVDVRLFCGLSCWPEAERQA